MMEALLFPLAGGGLLGFGVGYLLKKMMKLAILAIGGIILVLGYLELNKIITVNWVTVENQTQSIMTSAVNNISHITQHLGHEIPIGAGLIGFVPGLVLGIAKG